MLEPQRPLGRDSRNFPTRGEEGGGAWRRRGEGRGKQGGTGIPRPTPLGSHRAAPALPVGSLRSLHHSPQLRPPSPTPRSPPDTIARPLVTRPTSPPLSAGCLPAPAGRGLLLPGSELPRHSFPHVSAFRQARHLALKLPWDAGSPGVASLSGEKQLWWLQLHTGTNFRGKREAKNVHTMCCKFCSLAFLEKKKVLCWWLLPDSQSSPLPTC